MKFLCCWGKGTHQPSVARTLPRPSRFLRPFGSIGLSAWFLLTVWANGSAVARAADEAAIRKVIEAGVQRLLEDQEEDGSWDYGGNNSHRLGMTALATLALYENGKLPNEKPMAQALRYIREHVADNTNTYSVALCAITLGRIGFREDRKLIREIAVRLAASQTETGAWGYTTVKLEGSALRDQSLWPKPRRELGDLSVSQFAVVALWTAQRIGAPVGEALERMRQRLAWAQVSDGGWSYKGLPDEASRDTMTLAGTYMWLVSSAWQIKEARRKGLEKLDIPKIKERQSLPTDSKADPYSDGEPIDLYDALAKAAFKHKQSQEKINESEEAGGLFYTYNDVTPPALDAKKPNPLVDDQPLKYALERVQKYVPKQVNAGGGYHYYFLWSVERLGVLLAREEFGGTLWYDKGTDNIVKTQHDDGSWGPSKDKEEGHYKYGPDTCFALLFLRKANLGSDITKLLIPDPERPFEILGLDTKFKTLAEAVAAAEADDTIEISGDGPYPAGGIVLDKPLTIRAAIGSDPTLQWQLPVDKIGLPIDPKQVPEALNLLVIRSNNVILEGLRFRMDPERTFAKAMTLIRCEKAGPFVLNCTFSHTNRENITCVECQEVERLFFRNCMFIGFDTVFHTELQSALRLFLINSLLYAPKGFTAAGNGQLGVLAIESTIHAQEIFDFKDFAGDVIFQLENNVLRGKNLFANANNGKLIWRGHRNLFDTRLWVLNGPSALTKVRSLSDWVKLLNAGEKGSKQTVAVFAVNRQEANSFSHQLDPQDWLIDEGTLLTTMSAGSTEQIGSNTYYVGAGDGYLQYRERPESDNWTDYTLPSQRK